VEHEPIRLLTLCLAKTRSTFLNQQDAKRPCNMLHGPCGRRNGPDEVSVGTMHRMKSPWAAQNFREGQYLRHGGPPAPCAVFQPPSVTVQRDRAAPFERNPLFTDPSKRCSCKGELDGATALPLRNLVSAARPKAASMLACTCFERALISSTPKFWGLTKYLNCLSPAGVSIIRRTASATS